MISAPGAVRRARARARAGTAIVAGVAALLLFAPGVARADQPVLIVEDQTGFACEYRAEGEPQVDVSINFDAVAGTGSSDAQVLSPDGETDLARGSTEDVRVAEGVVSARYPLLQYPDGPAIGQVVLEGTYAPAGETVTLRNRFPVTRNAQIIGRTVFTPLEVTWTTLRVGDVDLSRAVCEGQRLATSNRVLQPHRLVGTFSELRLRDGCARDPLTRFEVIPSEVGVSLLVAVEGAEGFTNLDLEDGSDTQSVQWQSAEGDPLEATTITVTIAEDGRRRSAVQATPDGLVLEQVQPLSLRYELALPGQGGTVTGACSAESVVTRIAVEPVQG